MQIRDPFRNEVRDLIDSNVPASELPLEDPRAFDSIRSVVLLASHLINLNALEEQEVFLSQAYRYFPDNFEINWQLGTLAQAQLTPARPEKALRHYLACLALQPKNPGTLLNISYCHLELDEEREGIAFAEKFHEVGPNSPDAYFNLANHFMENKDVRTAVKYGKLAYEIRATSEVTALYGLMLVGVGNRTKGLKLLKQGLLADPDHPKLLEASCRASLIAGKLDEVIHLADRLLKVPDYSIRPDLLGSISYTLLDRGKPQESKRYFELWKKLAPDLPDPSMGLIKIEILKRNFEEAERLCRQTIQDFPESTPLEFLMAQLLMMAGDFDRSLAVLEELSQDDKVAFKARMLIQQVKKAKQNALKEDGEEKE